MAENPNPGEKKAEMTREEEKEMWEDMTTKEIIEVAKAVGDTAKEVVEDNKKYLVKAKEEKNKAKNQPE
jgi:hypothetical protein